MNVARDRRYRNLTFADFALDVLLINDNEYDNILRFVSLMYFLERNYVARICYIAKYFYSEQSDETKLGVLGYSSLYAGIL
jgi:hypothetical protein